METQIDTIKDVTQDLINMCNMPTNQVKRAMDSNYLSMLVKANPNLNKQHFVEFITKAQLTGADPRLNQIYLIVHDSWNSQTQTKEPKGTTVFSYQFFIRLAQQTGELEGFDVDIIEDPYLDFQTGKKRPSVTARAWVQRKGYGKMHYKARLWEFAKTTKDGTLMGNWKASPYLMLEKCAVANVMRWAFPEVLGNFYCADEMEKATGSHVEMKPIIETKADPILIKKSEIIVETPIETVDPIVKMLDYFAKYNVTPIMIEQYLGKPLDSINEKDMDKLREVCKRLAAGEEFHTTLGAIP